MTSTLSPLLYCVQCRALFRVGTGELRFMECKVTCPTGMHVALVTMSESGALHLAPASPTERKSEMSIVHYVGPALRFLVWMVIVLGAFALLASIIAYIAMLVPPWLCPLVLACALAATGLVGIFALALCGILKGQDIPHTLKALSQLIGVVMGRPRIDLGSAEPSR